VTIPEWNRTLEYEIGGLKRRGDTAIRADFPNSGVRAVEDVLKGESRRWWSARSATHRGWSSRDFTTGPLDLKRCSKDEKKGGRDGVSVNLLNGRHRRVPKKRGSWVYQLRGGLFARRGRTNYS